MTITLDEDALAAAYKADLHERCTYYRLTSRFRECAWKPSGYCANCGRERPSLVRVNDRMTRRAVEASPVLRRLNELAREFDNTATEYRKHVGSHNELLADEATRAAAQLREVATRVQDGVYTQAHGVLWIRAAWRIITAIGRANLT